MRRYILAALLALLLPVAAFAQGISNPGYPIGQIPGTATNDNAGAGKVGEYISGLLAIGSAVVTSNDSPVDVISISLTPGDWDVSATCGFAQIGGALITQLACWSSATSVTFPTPPNNGALVVENFTAFTPGGTNTYPAGMQRISVAVTTTVYLSARTRFTAGTSVNVFGIINARRAR